MKKSKPYIRLYPFGADSWRLADEKMASISSAASLKKYQKELRLKFNNLFGPLHDARRQVGFSIRSKTRRCGVEINGIDLVSEHGYKTTGWTVCPVKKSVKRMPGLVIACGHNEEASLAESYLRLGVFAAHCGFFVFLFDPPGQGSRREVFLEDDHPVYWDPCKQHQHIGASTTVAGFSLTRFFISDCMTAVSFVAQRPEVDPGRIGFAGQSGGGLQTFFAIGADERIAAAVPSQATSTRRGDFYRDGFRDMEQTFLKAWQAGFDLHEMVLLFCPRPLRILSEYGYQDQSDIFLKTSPVYEKVGVPENIEITSATMDHKFTRSCRELTMSWLCRHLDVRNASLLEPDFPGFTELRAELLNKVKGLNAAGCGIVEFCRRSVVSQQTRKTPANALKSSSYLNNVGFERKRKLVSSSGRRLTDNLSGKFYCELLEGYTLPVVVQKGKASGGLALIVCDEGMSSSWATAAIKAIKPFVRKVAAMDVFNSGELRSDIAMPQNEYMKKVWGKVYGPDFKHAQDAFMAGTCPAGLAMDEIRTILESLPGRRNQKILLIGKGWPALAMLFTSCLIPEVKGCCLTNIPESYAMLMRAGRIYLNYNYLVPGLLKATDIPEIIKGSPDTRYAVVNPVVFEKASVPYGNKAEFRNVRLFSDAGTAGFPDICKFIAR